MFNAAQGPTLSGEEHLELFAQIGKAGGCAASQTEAIGRLVSLLLRSGLDPGAIARHIAGRALPVSIVEPGPEGAFVRRRHR